MVGTYLPDRRRTAFTEMVLGNKVTKASVLSADDDLFTVVGKCLITVMYGELTTAMTGAGTVAVNEKTDSIDLFAATTIDNDVIGTMYLVPGATDGLLNGAGIPVVKVAAMSGLHDDATDRSPSHAPLIVNGGSSGVTLESTETGNDADGEIEWTIFYLPLERGASIVALA